MGAREPATGPVLFAENCIGTLPAHDLAVRRIRSDRTAGT